MTHIMLDLETWGKVPGSDIRSIGACVFDPVAGTVGGIHHIHMDIPSDAFHGWFYRATDNPVWHGYDIEAHADHYDETENVYRKYPLARDPETVQWWNDQTPEAQAAFTNPVDLKEACERFTHWICEIADGLPNGLASVRIWANDPHFDVSILDAVFRAVDLPVPWHYRSPRSMKTITEAAGMTSADYSNYGTAHNALDDAIAQAMTVCEAYKRLGLQK